MATANTNKEWYEDDAAQNFMLNMLQRYNASKVNGDLTSSNAGIMEMLNANRPEGMDFGAFMPLMDVMGSQDFTKQSAITDSQGFIDQIFREYERSALPKIYSNPRQTGIYNDTSTQLLANDAYSSAVAKGQSQLVDNVMKYANARESQLGPVISLMQGMVSNNNAQMGAQQQANSLLAQSMGVQGTQQASAGQDNRASNLALAQGLYGIYRDYTASNSVNDSANQASLDDSTMSSGSDPYNDNVDDEFYGY